MIESDGKFYIYSTGGGSKSSSDGLVWTSGPSLFPAGIPQSTTALVPGDQGVWAPDVIYLNNQFYIYYSVANAQNACAIGLVTTPTLDPSSPSYKLTDRGVVVSNIGTDTFCAIDPCPALDASGNLWISYGSGYTKPSTANTIYVTRLDNATGLPSSADPARPGHPLEPGHTEGSYLYYHNAYYYLWWQTGGCCSGAASTYTMHLARAQNVTGPYSGDRIFYQSNGSIHGPGHIGIYDQCGASRFTYHYYPDTGGSVLGENELSWGVDGWPVAGPPSTTPLKPCGVPGPAGGAGTSGSPVGDAGSGAPDAGSSSPTGTSGADADASGVSTGGTSGDRGSTSGAASGSGGSGSASSGAGQSSGSSRSGAFASSGSGSSSGAGQVSGGGPPDSGARSKAGCSCDTTASTGMSWSSGALLVAALSLGAKRRHGRLNRRGYGV